MNIILLCGGSGKRLWPLSNDIRSKQFIKIFENELGQQESMIQKIYRQVKSIDSEAVVTVATSKSQVSLLRNQLGDNVGLSVEPCRRDTFPAIILATAYLHEIQKVSKNQSVVVCPVDQYVNKDYFEAVEKLGELAKTDNTSNLILMGITPAYPSEKYGYILPDNKQCISSVVAFKEKPTKDDAQKYIEQGALWNSGVFAYKLEYILDITEKMFGTSNYQELLLIYEKMTKISFDYAIVEKEKNLKVMRFDGKWMDIGTWNTFTEVMHQNCIGQGIVQEDCDNVHVINELDIPIICLGLCNIVVSVSQDGILVSEKEKSSSIKKIIDKLETKLRFAEKSWGDYKVLDITDKSMTIKLNIRPYKRMSYHSHSFRDEIWCIVDGKGKSYIDDIEKSVKPGDMVFLPKGCRHTIVAGHEGLDIIELQFGEKISVKDKKKFDYNLVDLEG